MAEIAPKETATLMEITKTQVKNAINVVNLDIFQEIAVILNENVTNVVRQAMNVNVLEMQEILILVHVILVVAVGTYQIIVVNEFQTIGAIDAEKMGILQEIAHLTKRDATTVNKQVMSKEIAQVVLMTMMISSVIVAVEKAILLKIVPQM